MVEVEVKEESTAVEAIVEEVVQEEAEDEGEEGTSRRTILLDHHQDQIVLPKIS